MRAALVIGCGSFDDPNIASLKFAGRDATRFADISDRIFGVQQDNLHVLADGASGANSSPTKAGLLTALTNGQRNLGGQRIQTLLVFFSGHGFHSSEENQDYLILKDTVLGAVADTALSFGRLLSYIQKWNAGQTLLFLDACRSHVELHKSLTTESPPVDANSLCPSGMVTFCSCGPGQKSYEVDECQSGLFTEAIIQSVDSGVRCSTVYEINDFLIRRVPELGKRFGKPIQNPFTKVEPLNAQNIVLVKDEIIREWRGLVPFGKELRPVRAAPMVPDVSRLMAIDFGTVNSISAIQASQTKTIMLLPSPDGEALVPSVVHFHPDLSYVVGKRASTQLKDDPNTTVGYIKRSLGSDGASSIYGRSIFPDDVATLIIKSLKTTAEEASGFVFMDVLASIPINFSSRQERGLMKALKGAGFSSVRFIPEPCAAALVVAESELKQNPKIDALRVLVIDLGGGTLDIAAIEIGFGSVGTVLQVIGVEGDPELGGIEYDFAIAECIENELRSADTGPAPIERAKVLAEAERAKIILNHKEVASVSFSIPEADHSEFREIVVTVNRSQALRRFREIDDRVINRIQSLLDQTRAGRSAYRLSMGWPEVIMLAGQGTKLFSLRERITSIFSNKRIIDRYQDSAVARGLGLYLGVLSPDRGVSAPLLLLNVYGKGLGLRYMSKRPADGHACVEIASALEANCQAFLVIESDTFIPTKQKVEALFSAGASRMTITPIERFGVGREDIFGTIVFERANDVPRSLDIYFSVYADFTVMLEVSVSKDTSSRKFTDHNRLHYQLNNYHFLPSGFEVVDESPGLLGDLRCVETTFRRLREIK